MLDLARVSQQITSMASESRLVSEDLRKRLDLALGRLQVESGRVQEFIDKLARSKTSWLVAGVHEPLDRSYALPARPPKVSVVAHEPEQQSEGEARVP